MANPVPQHNPTDGLNTAAQVTLASTGTGGSALTAIVPGRLYSSAISVSGATINGVVYQTGFTLTGTVKDVTAANTFSSGNSNAVAFKSYDVNIATITSPAGVVAAGPGYVQTPSGKNVTNWGQVILEGSFPTFDNIEPNLAGPAGANADKVYVQVILQVYP